MDAFYRLAPFIQDFIYQNRWDELRGTFDEMLDRCDVLLISGGSSVSERDHTERLLGTCPGGVLVHGLWPSPPVCHTVKVTGP